MILFLLKNIIFSTLYKKEFLNDVSIEFLGSFIGQRQQNKPEIRLKSCPPA